MWNLGHPLLYSTFKLLDNPLKLLGDHIKIKWEGTEIKILYVLKDLHMTKRVFSGPPPAVKIKKFLYLLLFYDLIYESSH